MLLAVTDPTEDRAVEEATDTSPSTPESSDPVPATPSAPPAQRLVMPGAAMRPPPAADRGRTIALATLGGFLALGVILIARGPGPRAPEEPAPAALLARAELPAASTALARSDGGPAAPTAPKAAQADAGAKLVPTWRVAWLEKDAAIEIVQGKLGKHTLSGALAQAGLSKTEQRRIAHAVEGIRRVDHGSSGDGFVVARERATGTVVAFEYIASPTDVWQTKAEDARLVTRKLELHVEKRPIGAALVITSDLAKAVAGAGLREEATNEIADALEGHGEVAVVKPGVRLRVAGHEVWVEGAFAGFHTDAVDYVPRTGSTLRVYFYERDASSTSRRRSTPHPGFYDAKGQQPFRGTFRSPLPAARITSRFNPKRMHPVLHVVMPHNGIDFGASSGTPVFASGSGTVHSAGDSGPCGNMVQIEHASGLTTAYCHLSRFAPGLHSGQHVEARQLVGYVGQTGRATGPHLHFAVKRGSTFIDPQALKMDGVRTLPPSDREVFAKQRAELDAALDAITLPAADGAVPEDEDKDEPGGEE